MCSTSSRPITLCHEVAPNQQLSDLTAVVQASYTVHKIMAALARKLEGMCCVGCDHSSLGVPH